MGKVTSQPTRVAGDIVGMAEIVAAGQERSTAKQISHWARIGMELERADTLERRRIAEVAAGREQFSTLTGDDRDRAHALVDARIMEAAAEHRFGPTARAAGIGSVSLDDEGRLVETAPDGTRTYL